MEDNRKKKDNIEKAIKLMESYRKNENALENFKIFNALENFKIFVDTIYSKGSVDDAWDDNKWWGNLHKHVVRVNTLVQQDGKFYPFVGTGTLIDIGIEELKGRVVITCAHCVGNDVTGTNTCLKAGKEECIQLANEKVFLSVTHEKLRSENPLPIINNPPPIINNPPSVINDPPPIINDPQQHENDKSYSVLRAYLPRNYTGFGTENDVSILILKDPIRTSENEILEGEKITKDNVLTVKSGKIIEPEMYVIGYGLSACNSSLNDCFFGDLHDAINGGFLDLRQKLMGHLGLGVKKVASVCGVSSYVSTLYSRDSGRGSLAGSGYSGSLAVCKLCEQKKYIGIYGGKCFKVDKPISSQTLFFYFLDWVKNEEIKIQKESNLKRFNSSSEVSKVRVSDANLRKLNSANRVDSMPL
ncbi:MAG: hypothetical protein LBB21_01585 [Holosporaceae bacterium]|jgi:hypothetical protein|nr:hypothetical protein [Holosporaceae bacterium]